MANTAASTFISDCLDIVGIASIKTRISGTTYETLALRWLNTAMYRISKIHDFKEMYKEYTKNTVADTAAYLFPSNWKVVIDFRAEDGTNSRKLTLVRPEHADKYRPKPDDDFTNIPEVYVAYGNQFELLPIPDAVYVMRMRTVQWPTVITATTDLIDYEPNKDDVILSYMLIEAFSYLQMLSDSEKWQTTAKQRLAEAYKQDTRNPDWAPVAEGFSSLPMGEHFAQDRYDTATGEWIVNPFLMRQY